MATVAIPPPYRGPTGGRDRVQVAGATVRACIEAVEATHPGFGPQVFAVGGKPHPFVKLFVNGELLDPGALDKPVAAERSSSRSWRRSPAASPARGKSPHPGASGMVARRAIDQRPRAPDENAPLEEKAAWQDPAATG